jgi:putative lysine transport system permease protein
MLKKKFRILIKYIIFAVIIYATQVFAVQIIYANDKFLVGMEAGYAPFNWTQNDNKNGAVCIKGTSQYANGYDVQIAKIIAHKLHKELLIVKTSWNGLVTALTSGKIDAIIAGMSPTPTRREEIDFSSAYYTSDLVIVVNRKSQYINANSLEDFKHAKITAQHGTAHYDLISQIPEVNKQIAMENFSQMRQAVISGTVDGYIAERPEAFTAAKANHNLKMIEFDQNNGFYTNPDDITIAVGMRKGDSNLKIINMVLDNLTETKRTNLMDKMIDIQPAKNIKHDSFVIQMLRIIKNNYQALIYGLIMTLFIALVGTILGLLIGLMIGIFRTTPKSNNFIKDMIHKLISYLLSIYIEIFRGTPMLVQALVVYYGTAQVMHFNLDRTFAALLIVSINTGAYMSEIVRGGIFAVDKGQFEAAHAIGMTHKQTMHKIILPQVIRNILPATGNEFIINIKDTSVLNVISVVELYFVGNTIAMQNFQYFQTFTVVALIYFIITFIITRIMRFIEYKIDGKDDYLFGNQMQI